MAGAQHYGATVLSAVERATEAPGVRQAMSPITQATVGSIYAAGLEVLSADYGALLGNLGLATALDLAGQIGIEAISEIASAVPIIGETLGFVISASDDAYAAQEAERAAARARAEAHCRARANDWTVIPSGPSNETLPADLLLRADWTDSGWVLPVPPFDDPSAADPAISVSRGWWVPWNRPQKPMLGQWIEMLTEVTWSKQLVAAASDWSMRHDHHVTLTDMALKFGYPSWDAVPERLPALGGLPAELAAMRHSIASLHPYVREFEGLDMADGGVSLWPLYQDMLAMVLWRDRPISEPRDALMRMVRGMAGGIEEPVPPLGWDAAMGLYGGRHSVLWEPADDGYGIVVPQMIWGTWTAAGARSPGAVSLCSQCRGPQFATMRGVYDMARGWNLMAHAQVVQAQHQVGEAHALARQFARDRLVQLGVRPSGGSISKGRDTLRRLVAAGAMSDATATRAVGQDGKGKGDSSGAALGFLVPLLVTLAKGLLR